MSVWGYTGYFVDEFVREFVKMNFHQRNSRCIPTVVRTIRRPSCTPVHERKIRFPGHGSSEMSILCWKHGGFENSELLME